LVSLVPEVWIEARPGVLVVLGLLIPFVIVGVWSWRAVASRNAARP